MQSKRFSLIESICNVSSGFIVSVLLWEFVICPVWGIERKFSDGIQITLVFTIASIIRGYIWRRAFNRMEPKA